ncbi:unnamed protein product [Brassicogethes aeneus]|uniref:Nuclear pore complex protein Nup154 n=1 Tax=Brassicogethes aeneus TaxID=1431903 RepID=A0A9P0B984_BRAAE|nr:unnamed protein product [Brassicogethes aeneus]
MNVSSIIDQTMDNTRMPLQKMEIAARNVDRSLNIDCSAPRLIDQLNVNAQTGSTASGLIDNDYPLLNGIPFTLNNMTQIKTVNNIPLPPEIVDHFTHIQCHCMMGLFPEINRAWLTVDSDIYVWTYEENSDLAYFDGINETILCVGLVKPKPGVFHNFIKYLLVLTTSVDIVVLGVTFTEGAEGDNDEIQLIPDPVFTISTDGATISTISGTDSGRLFLGSKEGNLFEISYQAESGWFGKRCKKVNLSTSSLSFLVPSFLNAALSEEDGIAQIAIDNTRNILYILTEKGSIEVCDLGEKGNTFSRVTKLSQAQLVSQAMTTVKTLDSQNFRPIVSISAVEACDSANVNLVAVSQTGVRFYMSVVSLSNQLPNQRPYTLALLHVRLPPGYSANIAVRPRCVHMSHYRDRNCVLVSTVKDKDVLWCISSDLFPFNSTLMEAYTTVNLDGPVLAIAEVRHDSPLQDPNFEAPPLAVRQHFEAQKKYVVLTSHGVQILVKLRPVDLLRQILRDSRGHDSETLKAFFMILKEDQACAASLILASLENDENTEIADCATRCFFTFGGEPKVALLNQTSALSGSTMFSPNIISTPAHNYQQNMYNMQSPNLSQTQQSPNFEVVCPFVFSSKHNGLYLYLGRILRPVWNRRCVNKVCIDGKTFTNVSTISINDCIWILNNLTALHNFITQNTQLSSVCNTSSNANANGSFANQTTNATRSTVTVRDAQLEERRSLDALKIFANQCCQLLGFWRILCEHRFHELIGSLPENQQQVLQNTTFKELFLYRHDICSFLITTLVNSYLGDNASVDSISNKLREVCPQLYKSEDAAFSKANEILKMIRTVQNTDEKEEMLISALQLCKSIGANIKLREISRQFTALKAYKAVIELCHYYAQKVDPENIAEHFYNNDDNAADHEGYGYYRKRMEVYTEVLAMLDTIYFEQNENRQATFADDCAVDSVTRQVISQVLDYPDEIMHIALYEWMVSKNMTSDLIKISQPSLEVFLKRSSNKDNGNIAVMDLLWKYYESNNNHASAAKILNGLASQSGGAVSLKERLSYLARAIMCMRSDKVGYAPCLGVFLRDLEDKMEVAKVQEQILDAITNMQNSVPNAQEVITILNSGLFEISQLYENFAEPFKLLECQLAIIDCAGYTDNVLIEHIWRQILTNELRKSSGSGNDRMAQVLTKVKHLARYYASSLNCFPLDNIVYELEMLNSRLRGDKNLVPQTLVTLNVPFEKLVAVYNNLITLSANDQEWQKEENEFHLSEATSFLIYYFLDNNDSFNSIEKRKITSLCQDAVATLFSILYSKPNTEHLVNQLRSIKAQLSRI